MRTVLRATAEKIENVSVRSDDLHHFHLLYQVGDVAVAAVFCNETRRQTMYKRYKYLSQSASLYYMHVLRDRGRSIGLLTNGPVMLAFTHGHGVPVHWVLQQLETSTDQKKTFGLCFMVINNAT